MSDEAFRGRSLSRSLSVAPDAEGTPTVWLTTCGEPVSVALMRETDVPAQGRVYLWPLIVRAVTSQ